MTDTLTGTAGEILHTIGTGDHRTGSTRPDSYGRGFVGALYDRHRTVKDDAALLRRHLRTAARNATPLQGWKVSVRYRTASMMQAVDVKLTPPEGLHARHSFPWSPDRDPNVKCDVCGIAKFDHAQALELAGASASHAWGWSESSEAYRARTYAQRIHDSLNRDDSDTMTDYFDVKFYGSVTVS